MRRHEVDTQHQSMVVNIKLAKKGERDARKEDATLIHDGLVAAQERRHTEAESRRNHLIDWWRGSRQGNFVPENLLETTAERMQHESRPGDHFRGDTAQSIVLKPKPYKEAWVGMLDSPQHGLPIVRPLPTSNDRVPIPYRGPGVSGEKYISAAEVEQTWTRVEIAQGLGSEGSRRGWARYVGNVHFASGEWIGIQLDHMYGRNNGSIDCIHYFTCVKDKGVFGEFYFFIRSYEDDITEYPTNLILLMNDYYFQSVKDRRKGSKRARIRRGLRAENGCTGQRSLDRTRGWRAHGMQRRCACAMLAI